MRAKASIAAIILAAAAVEAAARDWRAVAPIDDILTLVDADSVTRRADGRIRFVEHGLVVDGEEAAERGYDAYSIQVTRNCADLEGGVRRVIFYRGGRRVARPSGDARPDGAWSASRLCNGMIGYRSFLIPQVALVDHKEHFSETRLISSISERVDLVGRVVQGFEVNAVSLCGSEWECSEEASWESCWLTGNIAVPPAAVEPGRTPDPMRRDTANLAFRGRILRSPTGRGYGHLSAWGCQVEAEAEARPATLPAFRRPEPARGDIGRSPAAAAAHSALEAAISNAGPITAAQDGNSWRIDSLKARPEDWEAACGSDLQAGGRSLEPYPTAIMWDAVEAIDVAGRVVTIRTGRGDEETQFHLPNFESAERLKERLDRLKDAEIASVAQVGSRVTVRLRDGRTETLDHADAASAVQTAGIIDYLRSLRVASVVRRNNQVSALIERRVTLTFGDEAKARDAASLMQALRDVCRAPASARSG